MNEAASDYDNLYSDGLGYRARIGFLSPGLVDESLSAQFYRMAPRGVTMVRTSLELRDVTIEETFAMVARVEAASKALAIYKPGCIILGGSPTVAVPGHGSDEKLVELIRNASGIQAFAAQAAAIEALRKYGARKLAVATPFPEVVNVKVREFLEKSGFAVLSLQGLDISYLQLTRAPLQQSYELGRRCFEAAKGADALYFPGAPQPVCDNLDRLEKELGTLVSASMQATLWKGMRALGVKTKVEGYGKLLRDD